MKFLFGNYFNNIKIVKQYKFLLNLAIVGIVLINVLNTHKHYSTNIIKKIQKNFHD